MVARWLAATNAKANRRSPNSSRAGVEGRNISTVTLTTLEGWKCGRECVRRRRPRGVEAPCGAAPRRWSSVGTGRTSSVAGERARAQHSPLQLAHFLCHSCRGRDEPDQRGCGGGGGGGSYGGGPRDDGPGKRRRGGGAELEPGELEPGEIDYEPRGPRGVSSAVPLGGCPPCALLSRTSATARQGPKEWDRRCAKAAGRHRQTAVEAGPGVHQVPEATSNGGRR